MKKVIFAILLFSIGISPGLFGQNKNGSEFSFCKVKGGIVSFSELEGCPMLSAKNKKIELKSFTLSILVKTIESPEGLYMDEVITGNTLTKEVLALLKKLPDGRSKIFIENIIATEEGKEKKYQGFTFFLINSPSVEKNKNDNVFSFCKLTGETINFVDLEKCPTLISNNKKLELKSFTLSVLVKSIENPEGLFLDFDIIGNTLTKEVLEFFKKPHNTHLKVFVESIAAIESGIENKYPGFTFYLQ